MAMHLAIGCIMIQVFNFDQTPEIQRRNTAIITIGLTSFIIYHCVTDEFVLHCILFIALAVTVTWKIRMIIHERITDEGQKYKLRSLATLSTCERLLEPVTRVTCH